MNITTIRQPRAATRLHLAEAGKGQFYLVAASNGHTRPSRAASEAYTQVAEVLAETGAEIVHERVFASLRFESQVRAARKKALGHHGIPCDGPLTYIQGHPPWGEGTAAVVGAGDRSSPALPNRGSRVPPLQRTETRRYH